MAATRSHVQGFAALEKVLKAMPPKLAERELSNATRAGARVIAKEVKARAPRGKDPSEASEKYGPLHKNIRVSRVKKTRRSVEFEIHTGSAFWGKFIELGTMDIAPRPFMTPAFDTSKQAAIQKIGERLAKGVEKTAAELAGKFGSLRKSTRRRL